MIKFVWNNKYKLLSLIILVFGISIYKLKNPTIFYDSQRILDYADNVKNDFDSIEKTNLFLIGIEFEKKVQFENIVQLQSIHEELNENKNILFIQNIFNDISLTNQNFLIPFGFNKKIENKKDFNFLIDEAKKKESLFISKDQKKLSFIIELKKNVDENFNKNFIKQIENRFKNINDCEIYITGQVKAELYIKERVISELIYITFFSALFCCLILWYFSRNIKFVTLVVTSVLFSISITFMIAKILFGGIELVMIIMPAILFIVCVSDFMHLVNNNKQNKKIKFEYFSQKINDIGKPVALTSITTAIGFLSFCFSNVLPITRLGIITTIGIIISLLVILVTYAICVDLKLHKFVGSSLVEEKVEKLIFKLVNFQSHKKSPIILLMMSFLCFVGLYNFEINNHINDEFNKSSQLYKEMKFFDDNFGGYKQVDFNIDVKDDLELENILEFEKKIKTFGFVVDNSLFGFSENTKFLNKNYLSELKDEKISIKSRMPDIGSKKSFILFDKISEMASELNIELEIRGNGYLFDKLSNKITQEILVGLFMAISSICLLFLIISNFNFKYLLIILIPNTFPIFVCVGIMSLGGFYFSLSNAFIFAIIFGLIVDDSIHIISSYKFNIKRGLNHQLAIKKSLNFTGRAVIKTTIVIIITLIPLLFSEFNSISQLGFLTIISAIIAIIFDLIYLPKLIGKLLNS